MTKHPPQNAAQNVARNAARNAPPKTYAIKPNANLGNRSVACLEQKVWAKSALRFGMRFGQRFGRDFGQTWFSFWASFWLLRSGYEEEEWCSRCSLRAPSVVLYG